MVDGQAMFGVASSGEFFAMANAEQVDGLPWQRVLGSGGRISLRGELGMEQRFLLESEGVRFRGRRVDMKVFEHRFQRRKAKVPVQARKQRLRRK